MLNDSSPFHSHGPLGFRGFEQARHIMYCYEARHSVHAQLNHTPFLADGRIAAVHVNNASCADRVYLTAFDFRGGEKAHEMVFVHEPIQHLAVTPEFDHDYTQMVVPECSDLARTIDQGEGWVINMSELRDYDPAEDRRCTQRAVFLEHLGDMTSSGQVKSFGVGHGEADLDAA